MRTFELNGITFELITPRYTINPYHGYFCDENCIFNWYDRPSIYKVEIWRDWLNWARETEGIKAFEISSANGFQFTIGGLYIDENGNEYNIYITRDHNRIFKVNS